MDWKKIGKKLIFPPHWLLLILAMASSIALILVFLREMDHSPLAWVVYAMSFYTLMTGTVYCIEILPDRYRHVRKRLYQNSLSARYLTDIVFRTAVSLTMSLGINLLYVGINLWSWHTAHSWWFFVLAIYYIIMSATRLVLLGYVRRNQIGFRLIQEWKRALICACFLLLINLSVSSAVLMIAFQKKGHHYPGVMIYAMALYSFWSIFHAVRDVLKCRKLGSPFLEAAKIVSLSSALVSLLNLETAMLYQFGGDMSQEEQQLFILLTGAGVSIVIVILSVSLAIRAVKEIRRIQKEQSVAVS